MTIALTVHREHPLEPIGPLPRRSVVHAPNEAKGPVEDPSDRPASIDHKRINFADASAILFGPFRLLAAQRMLFEGDKPVRLGSRALDILIALTEQAGELVSKSELIARVWPGTFVEETNLTVNIAALRRALGDGQAGNRYIVNIPGRGYRFVAPVAITDKPASPAPLVAQAHSHNLPARLTRLVGRADFVDDLVDLLPAHRLLTIVGAAGVGKTSVALEAAEQLTAAYEHGVWLIDLAPIADPGLVPTALASALGLVIRSDNPLPGLIAAVSDKKMLLVLDNCGHVIEAAATLAAGALAGARGVHILATSREPLRVQGERVRRLPPLASPPASSKSSAGEALRFPAVQLFVERVAATMNEFELSESDAPIVGDICRKLDGLPLAIELAAARVEAFGVRGVARRVDDRFRLLTGSPRGTVRHRTMAAALDWSYQLLTPEEQMVFRRLAIFAGGFTLEAASAVAANTEASSSHAADIVTSLVMKSLVAADIGDGSARFRLLETMRAYALTKLAQDGEADAIARRHAGYYRDLLEVATNNPSEENLAAAYASEIDNIRAALTWTFAPSGDASIGVALAADSAPIWLQMSLLTECRDLTEKVLDLLGVGDRGTRKEMVLQTVVGLSLMFTRGMSSRTRAILTRANELAENLQNVDYQMRTLAGLTIFSIRLDEWRDSLVLARRFESVARTAGDPVAITTADCMLGSILTGLADYPGALHHARRGWELSTPAVRRAQIVRSGLDHSSVQARTVIALALWIQGLLDQSAQSIREVLHDADADGHIVSTGFALSWSIVVMSLGRDFDAAEGWIARLKYYAEKHDLRSYKACCLGFEGLLSFSRGDLKAAERLLRASLNELRETQYQVLYTPILSGLAETLAATGNMDDGLAAADEVLQRIERNGSLWWMPEALRIKGEILLLSNRAAPSVAEDHFSRSLDLARRQGALSFELRSAISLGRSLHLQGRAQDACDMLNSVSARFTEGFETPDLESARRLLEDWATCGKIGGT